MAGRFSGLLELFDVFMQFAECLGEMPKAERVRRLRFVEKLGGVEGLAEQVESLIDSLPPEKPSE